MRRLKRFEYCHDELKSCIAKVLQRLHNQKREDFLKDESLQIISSGVKQEDENAFQLTFREPVKSIIYINFKELKEKKEKSEAHMIYGIAHEIGHYFAGRGESGLLEKEANEWLKNWGDFNEIIKAVNHLSPINEDKGYTIGYEWACNQDSKELWKIYRYYLKFWNDENLTKKDEDDLEIELLLASKPNATIALNEYENKTDNADLRKGVAFGIMRRVRELEKTETKR